MSRTLHLALAPLGVGGPGQDGLWKDVRLAKNASVDIKSRAASYGHHRGPVNRHTYEHSLVAV